jgi:hypothetical protein
MLHKGHGLRLPICACYSWQIELNIGLDVSFDNEQNWKGTWEKEREVNGKEVYVTSDGNFR